MKETSNYPESGFAEEAEPYTGINSKQDKAVCVAFVLLATHTIVFLSGFFAHHMTYGP